MKIKLLSNHAKMPTRAEKGSAGFDLYVPKDTVINPGRNVVPLDFAIELSKPRDPQGSCDAHIRPRSGFSAKGMEGCEFGGQGQYDPVFKRFDADVLHGTIDSSYRGNVGVIIKSYEKKPFLLLEGTRIAQLVIESIYGGPLEEAAELSETERGEGGFGHTGTR